MNNYWNFVAVPTFLGIMFFGIYVLFTTDEAHFSTKAEIKDTVRSIQMAGLARSTPTASTTPATTR